MDLMMNEKSRPDPTVKSAKRVLEIFELFATRRAPATVMDVARELGYPQSSTSTLMESLRTLGYLSYDRFTRQFSPTLRIAFLGNWVQEDIYTDTNLLRIMADLQDKTGKTVILGSQNDIHVQYIHSIQGGSPLRLFVRPGTLRPLARASTGKMLLSAKSDSEIRALLIRINADEEELEKRVDLSELMKDIRFCREEGYFFSNGSVTEGAGVISMLLPPGNGHPQMALGIGAPLSQIAAEKDRIIDLLRDAIGLKFALKQSA
jgi:DNA-binding IclR family transcriptional regulator